MILAALTLRATFIHGILVWKAKVRKTSQEPDTPVRHQPQKMQKYRNSKFCYEQKSVEQKTNVFCDSCAANLCFTSLRNCCPQWHEIHQGSLSSPFFLSFFLKSRNFTVSNFILAGVLHCQYVYKMYIFNFFVCFFFCVKHHHFLFFTSYFFFLDSFFFSHKYSCLKQLPLRRKFALLHFDSIHLYATCFLWLGKKQFLDYQVSLLFPQAGKCQNRFVTDDTAPAGRQCKHKECKMLGKLVLLHNANTHTVERTKPLLPLFFFFFKTGALTSFGFYFLSGYATLVIAQQAFSFLSY